MSAFETPAIKLPGQIGMNMKIIFCRETVIYGLLLSVGG